MVLGKLHIHMYKTEKLSLSLSSVQKSAQNGSKTLRPETLKLPEKHIREPFQDTGRGGWELYTLW
jgi:hypothetical protein